MRHMSWLIPLFRRRVGEPKSRRRAANSLARRRLEFECLEDRTLMTNSPIASGLPWVPPSGAGIQQSSAMASLNFSIAESLGFPMTSPGGSTAALDQLAAAPKAAQAELAAEPTVAVSPDISLPTIQSRDGGNQPAGPLQLFVPLISAAASGTLLSWVGGVFQFADTLYGLFSADPLQKVLDRLNQLDQDMRQGFHDLQGYIDKEIQRDIDHQNQILNDTAVTSAHDADFALADYKQYGRPGLLDTAENDSSHGLGLIETELAREIDPFWLPGLLDAGNARIDYFHASDPNWAHNALYIQEMDNLTRYLAAMINMVRTSVESAHTIGEHIEQDQYGVSNFVDHLDRGMIVDSFEYSIHPRNTYARALADAQQERLQGIADELAYLSIPHFESILQSWKDLEKSFWLTPFTTTPTAGTPFTLTVTARDSQWNPITGYTGMVHLSSSDTQAGGLPADYRFTAGDHGVHTFMITLKTAGAQSVTATTTDTAALLSASSAAFTVLPAAASRFGVGAPNSIRAGVFFPINVTAYDPYANIATSYTGTVHVTSDDGLSAYYYFGPGGLQTFNVTLTMAGRQTVTVADATGSPLGTATVTVTPASATAFQVTGYPSPTTAGVEGTFTVTARDPYGNVDTGYRGTVHFSSSDGQAVLPTDDYRFTSEDNGAHTFRGTLKTATTQSITATDAQDGSISGSQTGIVVTPAAAVQFQIDVPDSVMSNIPFDIIVTARDAFGNVDTNYRGTVTFSTTDPDTGVVLPVDYTFSADDGGLHAFAGAVTLITPGQQVITVSDADNGFSTDVSVIVV